MNDEKWAKKVEKLRAELDEHRGWLVEAKLELNKASFQVKQIQARIDFLKQDLDLLTVTPRPAFPNIITYGQGSGGCATINLGSTTTNGTGNGGVNPNA